jgi:hypothetical protein
MTKSTCVTNKPPTVLGGGFSIPEGMIMFEHQKVLNKIEQWVEKLPYSSVKIEVEMRSGEVLVLAKDRQRPIGFSTDPK